MAVGIGIDAGMLSLVSVDGGCVEMEVTSLEMGRYLRSCLCR